MSGYEPPGIKPGFCPVADIGRPADASDVAGTYSSDEGSEESNPVAPGSQDFAALAYETLTKHAQDVILKSQDLSPGPEPSSPGKSGTMNARAYQLEMLAESLKQNVIVTMDTGSGKTQVAVLRIKAELERAAPEQIIWFLTPTVSLCAQQFDVIKSQIPAVQIKMLSGEDNVDSWSTQGVWDVVLCNVRVVVSTYQILLDALTHAFVPMARLALIVFDEAHNCVGKHPGSKIMNQFYRDNKRDGSPVPHILGLTASPIIRSQIEGMQKLEETMDAVCKGPTIHREELLACVKCPQVSCVQYSTPEWPVSTSSMESLKNVYSKLDIREDPWALRKRAEGTDRSRRELEAALLKNDTYVQNQMKSFCRGSYEISSELGPWAADYYISEVISRFRIALQSHNMWFDKWLDEEKLYLSKILDRVDFRRPSETSPDEITLSEKVQILAERLLSFDGDVVAIIFVKERITVAILARLLSILPKIKKKYRIGTMIGTSNYGAKKRDLWDLLHTPDMTTLQRFRSGKINLLIATSVLEEGIDVPACNLVICFDRPANLKSFIQRRGRARMRESSLVIFLNQGSDVLDQWQALEEEMRKRYEDQQRGLKRLQELEESEVGGLEPFIVEKTGARLDFDNAKPHLDHLCRVLSRAEFVDWRPDYIIQPDEDNPSLFRAVVLLPTYLPAAVRESRSKHAWKAEKHAIKDAAFQAYLSLYEAGLVNDNLLPYKIEDFYPGFEARDSEVAVAEQINPWPGIARDWRNQKHLWRKSVRLLDQDGVLQGEFDMVMPIQLPQLRSITAHLDTDTSWLIEFDPSLPDPLSMSEQIADHTAVLLALTFSHRFAARSQQQVVRFIAKNASLSLEQIGAVGFGQDHVRPELPFLVRDNSGCPYIFDQLLPSKPPVDHVQRHFHGYDLAPANVPYLSLKKWTRRGDFLHRVATDDVLQPSSKPYSRVYPATWAKVDTIPLVYAKFGMLIPSILHEIEVYLTAMHLSASLMHPIEIRNIDHVLTAISARSAAEPTNYERLEFLGDALLKFFTTINVTAQHTDWPEGYLSLLKDRLVANSRLSWATRELGLDKYIISKPFTGKKWRPLYVDDLLERGDDPLGKRKLSAKTLADVVEALIGASYVDGGIDKALSCISLFLKELDWMDANQGRTVLFEKTLPDVRLPPALEPLEDLIGYTFQKKALLIEAMTHASLSVGDRSTSLERLEFLGDAILDIIVVRKLFAIEPQLPHQTMHLLRTATVNGDILAFLAMEHNVSQDQFSITPDLKVSKSQFTLPLWRFMQHSSPAIAVEQAATERRHQELRSEIVEALEHGSHYPWALLARLQAKKFYSDIFESLLGAVWVDSGSLSACKGVVERFGLLPYLERILRDEVHALHPKEELGILADRRTLRYAVDARETENGGREFFCKVFIEDECVADVSGGVTKEEVKTHAAEVAVRALKGRTHGME